MAALADDDWRGARRTSSRPARPEPRAARRAAAGRRSPRHDVAAVAVAWALAWPGVTGAIVGARRPEQVDGWIDAGADHCSHKETARRSELTSTITNPRILEFLESLNRARGELASTRGIQRFNALTVVTPVDSVGAVGAVSAPAFGFTGGTATCEGS